MLVLSARRGEKSVVGGLHKSKFICNISLKEVLLISQNCTVEAYEAFLFCLITSVHKYVSTVHVML